jgi:enoyl-[acyl-carrier protein] reductase II
MRNRLNQLFDIRYPIALAGMTGITDAAFAAVVSEAGGLGTIAASKESGDTLKKEIDRLRTLTEKPFAVNIPLMIPQAKNLVSVVIEKRVPVVITAAGNPGLYTESLKKVGIRVVHVIPSVDAAKKAEAAGVDAVIAEGFESGGFASPYEIGTIVLIPQVVDAVKIPVIAAGGIADARGYAACLVLGAEGVSLGTAFLATVECSRVGSAWRSQLVNGSDISTRIVARGVMPIRVLINSASERLEQVALEGASKKDIANYIFTTDTMSEKDNIFPCGEGVGLIRKIKTVKELIEELVYGSQTLINRLYSENVRRAGSTAVR